MTDIFKCWILRFSNHILYKEVVTHVQEVHLDTCARTRFRFSSMDVKTRIPEEAEHAPVVQLPY
jgi:hypothetical protein